MAPTCWTLLGRVLVRGLRLVVGVSAVVVSRAGVLLCRLVVPLVMMESGQAVVMCGGLVISCRLVMRLC